MSFPGPGQSPNNNGGGNPFTNPFGRNNNAGNGNDSNGKGDKSNGNGSNGGPRPFWQSPWLWVVVVALLAVTMFQIFAGTGSPDHRHQATVCRFSTATMLNTHRS